jgi:hypothetical protein
MNSAGMIHWPLTIITATANKCVFCWRHHTNPVGTEWKWAMDEPEEIVEGAVNGHYNMIKQLKGVPGVRPERFEEAFRIRHCALSLVGEPIMYPRINDMLGMLHKRGISTFLVTNAQFPEKVRIALTFLHFSGEKRCELKYFCFSVDFGVEANHPALCQCGCVHKGEFEKNRSTIVQGLLGTVFGVSGCALYQGSKDG